jgi:hypothetical protein
MQLPRNGNPLRLFIILILFHSFYVFESLILFYFLYLNFGYFWIQVVPQADRVLIRLEQLSQVYYKLIQKSIYLFLKKFQFGILFILSQQGL